MKSAVTVEKIMREARISRWAGIRAMRAIEKAGVAKFVVGRNGWPTRLQA